MKGDAFLLLHARGSGLALSCGCSNEFITRSSPTMELGRQARQSQSPISFFLLRPVPASLPSLREEDLANGRLAYESTG